MEIIVKGIIIGVIFAYIGYIKHKEAVKGKLFYSKWIVWLGTFSLIFVLIILYALFTGQVKDERGEYIAIILLIFSFSLITLACFMEYKITLGHYDKEGIRFCTPWSKCKEYKWSEIDKITYNESMNWYIFHSKDNQKMRFSIYLTGIDDFLYFSNKKKIKFE